MAFSKSFQKLLDKVSYGVGALEKQGLTEDSPAYKAIRKYAIEQPNSKGSPYEILDDGTIRVKTYKDYAKMSKKEQTAYIESIEKASELKTINPKKTRAVQKRAFDNFKEQLITATLREETTKSGKKVYRSPYRGLSKDEASRMWKAFREYEELMGDKYNSDDIYKFEDTYNIRRILQEGDSEMLLEFLQYFEQNRFDLLSEYLL